MYCPFCATPETKVIDSRLVSEVNQIRRRRECVVCAERFTTYETIERLMPRIIKSDGRRDAFDEQKLRYGMLKALEKRPVSSEALEAAVDQIKRRLQAAGERDFPSATLGEWVMDALRSLDKVAYVRFASVYRNFADVDAFDAEIQKIRGEVHETSSET